MSALPEPRTAAGAAALAEILAEPARAVVAVDFDGTLAPIVERPDDARPAAGAITALAALADRVGCCAVVTGRAALEAVRLGGLSGVRRLEVLGHYGLERWSDGQLSSPEPVPQIGAARERLREVVAAAPTGVHLEDKEHSLVVHTRPAEDPAGALASLTPAIATVAAELGLETVPGRFVLEVRPHGVDKGLAVRTLTDEHDAHVVVYVGDDLGDLPAFDAIEELRGSGRLGLTVASAGGDAPPDLADRADLVVEGPVGVVAFLETLAAAIGQP